MIGTELRDCIKLDSFLHYAQRLVYGFVSHSINLQLKTNIN